MPFTVLVISNSLFFPFITGKNFLFRIIVEVMAAAWMGLLIVDFKKYWPRWNYLSAALAVFVGTIFLSSLFGVNFNHSFWSNFERMEGLVTHLHLLFLFFILAGIFRTQKEWFIVFGLSIAASIMVGLYGLLEFSGEIVSVADSSRIISTLGNPLYVAAYLSFHIFLSIFLWFQTKSKFFKFVLVGIVLFELLVFFLTGARGAFVGMITGLGIILFLSAFTAQGIKKKFILGAIFFVLLIAPILLNVFKDLSFIQNNDMLARFASISFETGQTRFTIWKIAFEAFKDRPVLGWGIDNFNVAYTKHYDPKMFGQEAWFDRAHNMPLEWLVSGGIIGFLAWLAIFGSILWAFIEGKRRGALSGRSIIIFIGMFIAYLAQLFFVFDTMATYLLFILVLGFLYSASSSLPDVWIRKSPSFYVTTSKEDKKNMFAQRVSSFKIFGIVAAFGVGSLLVITINIRPYLAARSLIYGFYIFDPNNALQVKGQFEKTLGLARGTVGATEIREHLAINFLKFASDPQSLQKPDVDNLYFFAVQEMEKQISKEGIKNADIKHNVLLAQLYGMLGVYGGNKEAFNKVVSQYERAAASAPSYVYMYPAFANMFAQMGDFEKATTLINKAEDLLTRADRFNLQIFYSKPLFYAAAQRYDEAYIALRDLSVKYGGPHNSLNAEMVENIVSITRSYDKEKTALFLEKVYLLDQTVYSVPLMLAQLYAGLGNSDGARFYAQKALELNPSIQTQVEQFLKALETDTSSFDAA